jgi:hypothetical protein
MLSGAFLFLGGTTKALATEAQRHGERQAKRKALTAETLRTQGKSEEVKGVKSWRLSRG